jgi:hypothetical protein
MVEHKKMVGACDIKNVAPKPITDVSIKCRSLANDSRSKLNVITDSLD